MKLTNVSIKVPGLSEAPLAPLTGVWFLARVHHGVAAQVVRVLEALAAGGAGVGLLSGVSPLVPLQRVHAGEGLAADGAGGHVDVSGRFGADALLLPEVRAEVELQDVRRGEHLVTQGTHEDLRVGGRQHVGHVRQQSTVHSGRLSLRAVVFTAQKVLVVCRGRCLFLSLQL